MGFDTTTWLLIDAFVLAAIMGAVASKTNFCTMGAISDWINMGNTARLGAWFFTIAMTIFGVTLLELSADVSLQSTLPPYRSPDFAWLRYLLGGFLFGIGMTLTGGCGNKTMINIGSGSLRSLFVLLIAGIMAYLMTKTRFYEIIFHSWIEATTINLTSLNIKSQSLADIFSAVLGLENSDGFQAIIGLLLGGLFLFLALRSKAFRKNTKLIIGSSVVGLCIVIGWYLSGGPLGQEAIETIVWLDERPLGVGVQSFTFVNPMGETINYIMDPGNTLLITFGMSALFGVMTGSLIVALANGTFRFSHFISRTDFSKHLLGGILMGIGGVLAMGCSIGQGITGISTLALGSIIALIAIMFGSALTIKISYYRMVYEDEANFFTSTISSLVDFKLLPESLRKLEEP